MLGSHFRCSPVLRQRHGTREQGQRQRRAHGGERVHRHGQERHRAVSERQNEAESGFRASAATGNRPPAQRHQTGRGDPMAQRDEISARLAAATTLGRWRARTYFPARLPNRSSSDARLAERRPLVFSFDGQVCGWSRCGQAHVRHAFHMLGLRKHVQWYHTHQFKDTRGTKAFVPRHRGGWHET